MRFLLAGLLSVLLGSPVLAQSVQEAFDTVETALSKGHGTSCNLEMIPDADDPYYPCLDIGPYRFVAEYGRIRGFVISNSAAPFAIAIREGTQTRFLYQGQWETDLPTRVLAWWHAISTPSTPADPRAQADDAVKAYLKSLNPTPPKSKQEAPATQPQPPVIYIVPQPYPAAPSPMAGSVAPGHPQPDLGLGTLPTPQLQIPQDEGTVIAPGVTRYPVQDR